MNSRTSSKIFFSTSQSSFPSPLASFASGHLESVLKYPCSAGSGHIARLPSCINHKRKKSSYIVTISEGETIYFCQKCMQTASKQGFEGFQIREFHGTPSTYLLNQPSKDKDKTNRNCILNHYLDNLKLVFEQISNFRQKMVSALVSNSNSNYIEVLFQRLETQIQRLKHCYRREAAIRDHQQSKNYQQMLCRAVWNEEDLQHMISRICKNYDKLTREPSETFNINLKLMNTSLSEKKNTLSAIQNQFSIWRKDSLRSFEELQNNFYQRLQKLWEECLLDCSISKISEREETGRDSSTQFCKIVQELSTTHTLA